MNVKNHEIYDCFNRMNVYIRIILFVDFDTQLNYPKAYDGDQFMHKQDMLQKIDDNI